MTRNHQSKELHEAHTCKDAIATTQPHTTPESLVVGEDISFATFNGNGLMTNVTEGGGKTRRIQTILKIFSATTVQVNPKGRREAVVLLLESNVSHTSPATQVYLREKGLAHEPPPPPPRAYAILASIAKSEAQDRSGAKLPSKIKKSLEEVLETPPQQASQETANCMFGQGVTEHEAPALPTQQARGDANGSFESGLGIARQLVRQYGSLRLSESV